MKKTILILPLLLLALMSEAQNQEIIRLKQQLENHSRQDTFRVNRLNDLATSPDLTGDERKKYAGEALNISQKINYTIGEGMAFVLLGSITMNAGDTLQSRLMLHRADSIARITEDLELKANVLWRSASLESDMDRKKIMYHQADSIAQKTGNLALQSRIVLPKSLLADPAERDSLLQHALSLATKAGNPQLQVRTLRYIAYTKSDQLEIERIYLRSDSIAKKAGDLYLQAKNLTNLAHQFNYSDGEKALSYFLQAEEAAIKSGNQSLLSEIQNSIGHTYFTKLSDFVKSMEYYLKAIGNAEAVKDSVQLAYVWMEIGGLYSVIGDHESALDYYKKAENTNKKLKINYIETVLQNSLGETYRLSGKYPEAIIAYNKSIQTDDSPIGISINESNLADVYTRMDSLPLAFQYAFSSFSINEELKDIGIRAWIAGILSRAYLKKHMADSAVYYATLGLDAAKQVGTIEYMRDNTLALANAYAYQNDFENAYTYRLRYDHYRDSMMNAEVQNRIAVQQ